jgi:succinate dehydrogenase / fumarate reductase, membrane anchor subunit
MIFTLLTKRYPGFRAWLVQRFTGLIMAIFSVVLLVKLFCNQPASFIDWQLFFAPMWWQILCILFWLSLSIHAWLGIRDVLKDYVPNQAIRSVALKACLTLIWLYLAWAIWLFSTI